MLNIQDADYVVLDDTVSRNRRARAYSRRVARRRMISGILHVVTDLVCLAAAGTLIWYVWVHI